MPNLKFSQFVEKTDPANVQFLVGYDGTDNVRIAPSNVTDLSGYLPLTGGTLTGTLDINSPSGVNEITSAGVKILASHDVAVGTYSYGGGDLNLDPAAGIASIGSNLGVKVANPARELDIDGNIQLTDPSFSAIRGLYSPSNALILFDPATFNTEIADRAIVINPVLGVMSFSADGVFNFLNHDASIGVTNISYSGSDIVTVDGSSGGFVGINNTGPSYELDVTGEGRFTGDVRANSFINTSDSSLKDGIKDIRTDLVSLRYKEYTLKDDKYGKTRYGVLAEDLKDTHPEFVHYNDRGEAGVDYISLLVKKVAELETRLNDAGIK